MTIYRSSGVVDGPATSGHIPAVRRRRKALRTLFVVVVIVLIVHVLLVEAYTNARVPPGRAPPRDRASQCGARRDPRRRPDHRHVRRPAAVVPDARPDDRADLRRRPGPEVDAARSSTCCAGTGARHVLRRRLAGGPASGPGPADRRARATRWACTRSPTRDLADAAGVAARLEYSQTQMAIADATGVTTSLLRSAVLVVADAIDDDELAAGPGGRATAATSTVLNDMDSQDWARPGVDAIVAQRHARGRRRRGRAVARRGRRPVADRRRARPLHPGDEARGYRFTTVSEGCSVAGGRAGGEPGRAAAGDRSGAARRWSWAVRIADAHAAACCWVLLHRWSAC